MTARAARTLLIGLARVGLSVALVSFVVWKVGGGDLAARLHHVNGWSVAASAALLCITILLHAWRWMYVLGSLGYGWRFSEASRETWIGYLFNQVLPTSAGGDGVRVLRLFRLKVPIGPAFRSVLYERFFALAVVVLLGLPAVPLLLSLPSTAPATIVVCIAEASGVVGFGLLLTRPPRLIARLAISLAREIELLRRALLDRAHAPVALAVSALMQVVTTAAIVVLAHGLGIQPGTLMVLALLIPPIMLLAMLPVSFAGWGLREGVMVAVLGEVGVAAPDALLLSLVFGGVMLIVSLPGGAFLALGARGDHLPIVREPGR